MNRLDATSYYLSYTEFVPFLSIASGIVHLICAIRDRAFGKPAEWKPSNEDLFSLAHRKLDDWSYVAKGILAIIPFLGNFILAIKWINRYFELSALKSYYRGEGDVFLKDVPDQLFNHRDFLDLAYQQGGSHFKGWRFAAVFARASVEHRGDDQYVLNLIRDGFCPYEDLTPELKNNREIVLAILARKSGTSFFETLSEDLRNDPEIAKMAFSKAEGFEELLVRHITSDETLKSDEQIYVAAVRSGRFKYDQLDSNRQNKLVYAKAAVLNDHRIWNTLPEHLRNDLNLLKSLVWSAAMGNLEPKLSWADVLKTPWYLKFFENKSKPTDSHQVKHMLRSEGPTLLRLTAN